MVRLRDLYVGELSDLLDAEEQILRELPVMAARASSPDLRELFDEHYRETRRHIERLESLFQGMDERPRPMVCHGVRGLIEEARERHAAWDRDALLDAALIGAAQRLEHYEIAAYGCARAYAAALGDHDAVLVLEQTRAEEGRTDRRLADLVERQLRRQSPFAPRPSKPTSLMPGVWVTETTGFASVPPRADSDLWSPQSELMLARGEPDPTIDRDAGGDTTVAIDADQLGRNKAEERQPVEKRD
jgi:ferritin-like metal-binding protein YciE